MKTYKKLHESKEVAKERGGNVKQSVKNGKILLEYSFPNENKTINIFDGVNKKDAFDIYDAAKDFLKPDMNKALVPFIQKYLYEEFKWGKNNEVVDILNKDNTYTDLFYTIIPYHEVIEWLHHRGSSGWWDKSHSISVEITGNRLKQILPQLEKYNNNDIEIATEYLIHGKQKTGNPLLDEESFHMKKTELSKNQLSAANIIQKNWNDYPLFQTINTLLNDIINQYKMKYGK